jgi:NAD(P)H-nitrite reductase large subunit
MNVLVVGAGPAGVTVAETLRAGDPTASITMISAEPYPPYSPPALADSYLTGRDVTLFWKGRDVAERLALDYRSGVDVAMLDAPGHRVILRDGGHLAYEQLVIATGSRLYAPIAGSDLPGVHDFKSLRAANAVIDRVRRGEARTALIVGAGFIGVEVALLLADLGVHVTMIEQRPWVMPTLLDPETAALALGVMQRRGVGVRLEVEALGFIGDRTADGVRVASGETLHADLYLAATGVWPNVGWLDGSGIAIGRGIRVDDHLRTNLPDVHAAGDVVEARDRLSGVTYVHAIFPNAVRQGQVVADDLLGRETVYEGAEGMNSLKHLGLPLMAVGAMPGDDEVSWRRDGAVRRVFLTDGRIVGFRLAGDVSAAGVLRSLMLRGDDVRRFGRRLAEPRFGVADLVGSLPLP